MKDLLFKFLYKTGAAFLLRSYKQRNHLITILCLHRVSDEESLTFPPFKIKDFEKLLQYIDRYYQVTTIANLNNIIAGKPSLVLSFDDGFLDFYENALPLMRKYGILCNLNVVTKCLDNNFQIWTQRQNNLLQEIFIRKHECVLDLGSKRINIFDFHSQNIIQKNLELFHFLISKDEIFVEQFLNDTESKMPFKIPATPMMSWENLNDSLKNYEIELGSHSVSHITLSNISNRERLKEEINNSKILIEKRTGRKVNIFALPNGNYNDEVITQCQYAGYKHVLMVDEKLLVSEKSNELKLPRLLIPYANFHENLLKVENFQNVIKKLIK